MKDNKQNKPYRMVMAQKNLNKMHSESAHKDKDDTGKLF